MVAEGTRWELEVRAREPHGGGMTQVGGGITRGCAELVHGLEECFLGD